MSAFDPPVTLDEVRRVFGDSLTIEDYLPAGGQGALFVVQSADRCAVLKIYHEAYRVRAERECEDLERLDSENIVRLLDSGEIVLRGNGCIYTITEFVEGESLKDRIRRKVLSEEEARRLGIDVATAIDELWQFERLVHRDIKPGNIVVREDGSAVILDLGIAKHTDQTTITQYGFNPGTPGYMSPEQARGRRGLTFKSDSFSLGIVLYESVTRVHPFGWRQDLIGRVQPQPLKQVAGVSDELAGIVHSLLEFDPLDRPRSCEHLIALLMGE